MKMAIMADLHLNKATYKNVMDREYISLPFRTADFIRAFEWSVTECIDNIKPDLVVISGDIYETYNPGNEVRGFFSRQLSRLSNSNISVYIIIGNHDVCQKHSALSDIEELKLPHIKIMSSPTIEKFTNPNGESVNLLLFPYSLDIERGVRTIKNEFYDFLKRSEDFNFSGIPSLFFGHFPVCGGIMNRYNPGEDDVALSSESNNLTATLMDGSVHQEAYRNRNSNDIGVSDIDELNKLGVEYVFLGDFHEFQFINTKKCKSWYCGSLEKNSFNEKMHTKSFMVYDSNAKLDENMGLCRTICYPYCRPMLDLFGNMDAMKSQFYTQDFSKYQNAIVRLNFEGNDEERADFMIGLDVFKKDIVSKINAIHIYHSISPSKSSGQNVSEVLSKMEKSLQDKGHMEATDVIEVVKEMIVERISDEQERKDISEIAIEIYKKTMIGK